MSFIRMMYSYVCSEAASWHRLGIHHVDPATLKPQLYTNISPYALQNRSVPHTLASAKYCVLQRRCSEPWYACLLYTAQAYAGMHNPPSSWKLQASSVPGYTGLQRPCESQSGFGVVRRHAQRVVQLGEPGQVPARRVEPSLRPCSGSVKTQQMAVGKCSPLACSRAARSTVRISRHTSHRLLSQDISSVQTAQNMKAI